jgi:carbon monoxide dehydrogenase subunit G
MRYTGSFEVTLERSRVYEFATDLSKITKIFPDVQNVEIVDAEHFTMKAKVGVSAIKGTMDVKCAIAEKLPSKFVKLRICASGLDSVVEMETGFSLEDGTEGGTLVTWTAEANVAGLMARVGSRLMDSVAQKYISQIVEALKLNLV